MIFTGRILERDLLSGYYLRSDLFVLPSLFDTASLAPIEAAALKLPQPAHARLLHDRHLRRGNPPRRFFADPRASPWGIAGYFSRLCRA